MHSNYDFFKFLSWIEDFNISHGLDSFTHNQSGFLYSTTIPYYIHFTDRVEVLWAGRFGVRVPKSEADDFKLAVQQIMDNLDDYLISAELEGEYELSIKVSEKDSYGEFQTLEVFMSAAYKTPIKSEEAQTTASKMEFEVLPMKYLKNESYLSQSSNFLKKYLAELDTVLGLYTLPEYSNFSTAHMGEFC